MQRMRRDHEPQWLLLPLLELRVDERVLVIRNVESRIRNLMTGTVLHEQTVRATVHTAGGTLPRFPSLTSLAFLLPVVLLYWQVGGPSALVADPNTGVHVQAGE